jgi:superfamily II DNA or RNA helicase
MIISNKLIISPSDSCYKEAEEYCKEELTFANPKYEQTKRMGFWAGNIPKQIRMYSTDSGNLILPFGCYKRFLASMQEYPFETDFAQNEPNKMQGKINLYDYQETAVRKLYMARNGILIAPTGAGKTMCGLALIKMLGKKALWLTHTKDLLNQSKERCEAFYTGEFGTITEGKVNIGRDVTFATVQTMAKQDLSLYKYSWDVVIVDEVQRVCATPNSTALFETVLNNLAARHKYGLTASLSRADRLQKCAEYLIGSIIYEIPREAVADKIVNAKVEAIKLNTPESEDYLGTDGMLNYTKLLEYLCKNVPRTNEIASILNSNSEHYNLILSDRTEHLRSIMSRVERQDLCCMIDASMVSKKAKQLRQDYLEMMRTGEKRYLFATYGLAKEGLDIPRLDRLYLTTPHKDKSTILQSVGRIRRKCEGKGEPIVYDFVDDNIEYCVKAHKTRRTTYKKIDCIIDKKY